MAAHACAGEPNLCASLTNIVEKMPQFVRTERPRVPNPANPAEDYADKWVLDSKLERCFWQWHTQVRADLKRLPTFVASEKLPQDVERTFGVLLGEEELRPFAAEVRRAPAIVPAPAVVIPASTPRPWGHGDRKRL